MKFLINKIEKAKVKLDDYLIMHHPFIWACQLTSFFCWALFLLTLNVITSRLIEVSIHNMPSFLIRVVFFYGASLILAFYWFLKQKLLLYRTIHGKVGKLFYLTLLFVVYLVTISCVFIAEVPGQIIDRRIDKIVENEELPPLDLENFSIEISSEKRKLDESEEAGEKKPFVLPGKVEFSEYSGSKSFRIVRQQPLSDYDLIYDMLIKSDLGSVNFSINSTNDYFDVSYEKWQKKKTNIKRIFYKNYTETKFQPKNFEQTVYLRRVKSLDTNNNILFSEIYHYRDINTGDFKYMNKKALYGSLLIDKLSIGEDNPIILLKKISAQISELKSAMEDKRIFPFILALGIIGIFCAVFVESHLGKEPMILTLIIFIIPGAIALSINLKYTSFFENIFIYCCAMIVTLFGSYRIASRKKQDLLYNWIFCVLVILSFLFTILFFLNITEFEPLLTGIISLDKQNHNLLLLTFISLIVLPIFFAEQMSKIASLPK